MCTESASFRACFGGSARTSYLFTRAHARHLIDASESIYRGDVEKHTPTRDPPNREGDCQTSDLLVVQILLFYTSIFSIFGRTDPLCATASIMIPATSQSGRDFIGNIEKCQLFFWREGVCQSSHGALRQKSSGRGRVGSSRQLLHRSIFILMSCERQQ